MAGHSQFKNIMHRKGAQDAKRAKVFTRLIRELTIAARSNNNPEQNPRLKTAINSAKKHNLPRDTMLRAIERGSGDNAHEIYEEVRYEGYGPFGVAIIVQATTDNRNRTAAEMRAAFHKAGGNLGESNCVVHMFDLIGVVSMHKEGVTFEELFDFVSSLGALDVVESEDEYYIYCQVNDLHHLSEELHKKFGKDNEAERAWVAKSHIEVTDEQAEKLESFIQVLDNCDDVQKVFFNFCRA